MGAGAGADEVSVWGCACMSDCKWFTIKVYKFYVVVYIPHCYARSLQRVIWQIISLCLVEKEEDLAVEWYTGHLAFWYTSHNHVSMSRQPSIIASTMVSLLTPQICLKMLDSTSVSSHLALCEAHYVCVYT